MGEGQVMTPPSAEQLALNEIVLWLDDNLANEEDAPWERRAELIEKALMKARALVVSPASAFDSLLDKALAAKGTPKNIIEWSHKIAKESCAPPVIVPSAEGCTVLAGKLKQFAEECLRRYKINPSYCAEIMHTQDVYHDIIRLCEPTAPKATAEDKEALWKWSLNKAQTLVEAFAAHREAAARGMLRHVVTSLVEYPKGGGDIGVIQEVERIEKAAHKAGRLEEAAWWVTRRGMVTHQTRITPCQCAECKHVESLLDL